jgi:hypothetical protein
MPFKSKAQVRWMFANLPQVARKWRSEHPGQNLKKLPERKKKK